MFRYYLGTESTGVSHDQRRPRYFPMNLINNSSRTQRFSCFPQCDGKSIEFVPEFLTNLRISNLFDLPGEYVLMNPEIFSAVSAGNKECLEKLRSYGTPMACLKSNRGDSILHLAAAWGHLELVKIIVSECPCPLLELNSMNQILIHVAARAGHLAIVEALVASVTYFSTRLSEEEREILNLYDLKDRDGNTAMHLALTGRHVEIAACLVIAHQCASFLANKDAISPLYLAIEAGNVSLVEAMLKTTGNKGLEGRRFNFSSQLEGSKFLVHVALKAKNTDALDVILKEDPSIVGERDEEGMTCLSFGASTGFYKGVCNLLDRSTKSVYVCNNDGSFPIHLAAKNGHIRIVNEILKRCPDSKHLLSLRWLRNSRHDMWLRKTDTCFLRMYEISGTTLLNISLTWWWTCWLIELLKSKPLLSTYKPRGAAWLTTSGMTLRSRSENQRGRGDKYKNLVNILVLVATLVAIVTFGAGIAVPGGFNSSAPNLGMAILANNVNFSLYDTL